MACNTTEMQQQTGESLRNDLKLAFGAFYQKERYQNRVAEIQNRQQQPKEQKDSWKLKKILKKPPQWMNVVLIILWLIVGYLTVTVLWGDRKHWAYSNLEPLLVGMFSISIFQATLERRTIAAYLKKLAEKLKGASVDKKEKSEGQKDQDKTKQKLFIVVGVIVVITVTRLDSDFFNMILWWLFYLVNFIGTFRFMGWLEYKYIHAEKWEKEADAYFTAKDEKLNKELVEAEDVLKSWNNSEIMAFACATVPDEFQNVGNLAVLLNVMENKSINALWDGIAVYEKQTCSEERRKQLKEIYWQQLWKDEEFRQKLNVKQ